MTLLTTIIRAKLAVYRQSVFEIYFLTLLRPCFVSQLTTVAFFLNNMSTHHKQLYINTLKQKPNKHSSYGKTIDFFSTDKKVLHKPHLQPAFLQKCTTFAS